LSPVTLTAWVVSVGAVAVAVALWFAAELELVENPTVVRRLQGAAVVAIVAAVIIFPASWAL
jgi:hypothetical protein